MTSKIGHDVKNTSSICHDVKKKVCCDVKNIQWCQKMRQDVKNKSRHGQDVKSLLWRQSYIMTYNEICQKSVSWRKKYIMT